MILSEWAFTSGHSSSITLKQRLRAFLRARIRRPFGTDYQYRER